MLENEGIVFEETGGVSRIRKEHFMGDVSRSVTASSNDKKRQRNDNAKTKQNKVTKKQAAPYTSQLTEEHLKEEIMALLKKRLAGKTC